jgi:hypothetical protein
MNLLNHTTFSDFSALHMTPAAAPAAAPATERARESGAVPGLREELLPAADTRCGQDDAVPGNAGMSQGRIIAPPFSWLGGDAWPDFPARADTAP